MKKKNAWEQYNEAQMNEVEALSVRYRDFISTCKTERECASRIIKEAEGRGYEKLEDVIAACEAGERKLAAGDKIWASWMNKSVVLVQVGHRPMAEGLNILGAHIDSPRMDIKQDPLYEDTGFAMLDTHYYGGIKKYQWVTIPLALHGVVVRKDGTTIQVNIGEDAKDPVFFISDLLVHLSQEQLEKKAAKVIEGEALDLIVGNRPIVLGEEEEKEGKIKEKVKETVLRLLKEKYGMEEEDFISAEIEVVPAGEARDAGFDGSMILGYGHDDRVCAYSSLEAMLDMGVCDRTSVSIFVDKEEIGSVGATGMQSRFFENTIAEILHLNGEDGELALKRCLAHSDMLSSDVSSAFDPTYASSFDKKNVAYLGGGMVFNKFTGARGKSGSNDANAEYVGHIRSIMDGAGVTFQTAELGRVDLGGGGTIAYILALYGMNVIDCGVPVLNMHAPHEAISKADLYEAKRGYMAFLEKACL